MKLFNLIALMSLLTLISCGSQNDEITTIVDYCPEVSYLNTLRTNQMIADNPNAERVLLTCGEKTNYTSGSYCVDSYLVKKYDTNTFNWVYYYSIDVSCRGKVISIYKQ